MTRIRQFAKDMGITYNKAKNLVQKGKKRRDGGSTVLEKFTMPIKIVAKKKEVAKPKPRPKNLKKKDPFRADKTISLNREFSKKTAKANEDAMKNVVKKKVGGLPPKKKEEKKNPPRDRTIRPPKPTKAPITLEMLKKMGIDPRMKKAMGGLKDVPSGNKGKGLSKLPTEVRNKMGFKKKGGAMKMKLGGVARGGGAAISGTRFKGVY